MRAVVYARYSSDLQRQASIADQIHLCRRRIEQEGWQYLHTYTDRAVSGASALRPAYQSLLEDARQDQFDIVVAEALDRLSRDQEDVAGAETVALCRHTAIHPLGGGDHGAACRPQGHNECAVSEGPRRQDPTGAGRPGTRRQIGWGAVLRL